MIASNNLFVKGLTRFLPNGRVFGVDWTVRFAPQMSAFSLNGEMTFNWSLTLSLCHCEEQSDVTI